MKLTNKQKRRMKKLINATLTTGILVGSVLPVIPPVVSAQYLSEENTSPKTSVNEEGKEEIDSSESQSGLDENKKVQNEADEQEKLSNKEQNLESNNQEIMTDGTIESDEIALDTNLIPNLDSSQVESPALDVPAINEGLNEAESIGKDEEHAVTRGYTDLFEDYPEYQITSKLEGDTVEYNVTLKKPNVPTDRFLLVAENHARSISSKYSLNMRISLANGGHPSLASPENEVTMIGKWNELKFLGSMDSIIPERAFVASPFKKLELYYTRSIEKEAFLFHNFSEVIISAETLGDKAFYRIGGDKVNMDLSKVTSIGNSALNGNGFTSVDLSKVTSIGEYAFSSNKLTSVDIPNETSIGIGAFKDNKITRITMPKVTSIDDLVFRNNQLTNVDLPKVTSIGNSTFEGNKITSVKLPEVTSIGNSTFLDNQLTSVDLPKVTSIADNTFKGNKITSIKLPEVTSLGNYTFDNNNITNAYLTNVTVMQVEPFRGNPLKKAVVGFKEDTKLYDVARNFGTEIEDLTILNMKDTGDGETWVSPVSKLGQLKNISLPNLTRVGDYAFYAMDLTNIDIPKVTTIGKFGLRSNKLTNISLPNVESIDDDGLMGNDLTNVNLPKLKNIGKTVFTYNSNLRSVFLPSLENAHNNAWGDRNTGGYLEYVIYPNNTTDQVKAAFEKNKKTVGVGIENKDIVYNLKEGDHQSLGFDATILNEEAIADKKIKLKGLYEKNEEKIEGKPLNYDFIANEETAGTYKGKLVLDEDGTQTDTGATREFTVNIEKTIHLESDLIAKMVSDQLKIEFTHDFTEEQLSQIKELEIKNNEEFVEKDLEDIAKLSELEKLWIQEVGLKNIAPLANNLKLKELYINKNEIEDITALANLEQLKIVDVSRNKISNINALEKLTNLEKAWLENNEVSDVSALTNLKNLSLLHLYYNHISNIEPIIDILTKEGIDVNLRGQKIKMDIQEAVNGKLSIENVIQRSGVEDKLGPIEMKASHDGSYDEQTNQLNWNTLTDEKAVTYEFKDTEDIYTGTVEIPVTQLSKITIESDLIAKMVSDQLKIEFTHDFTEEQLSQIKELEIKNNEEFVEKDLEDIAKLTELERLVLDDVELKNIDPLANNIKLKELSISGNDVEDITALANMKQLKMLSANHNKISNIDVLEKLTELERIYITSTEVSDVSALANLKNLNLVYLYYNHITNIEPIIDILTKEGMYANLRGQKIKMDSQEAVNGKLSIENVIQRSGVEDKLGPIEMKASHDGSYDEQTNQLNWNTLTDEKAVTYEFKDTGDIYTGTVEIPVTQLSLNAPIVNPVLSTDKKISGKADPKATITAKVTGKEIAKGEAKSDGTFELVMAPQKEDTLISVTQTVNGHESPATEITVEKAKLTAYNTYKLGYWRDYGFILEGQAGIFGKNFTNKTDVTKTVELVNTETNQIEASSNAVNTNWYDLTKYDGYQAIITNEMIDKLADGNYRLQVKLTLKDGETVTQNLAGTDSLLRGFIGKYQDKISGLGKHGVGEKVLQFNEGLGQVTMNVAQGTNQVNVLNSRVNAKEENVLDLWIASKDYDYQAEHTKYLVIKDSSGKEVYNKKAPTWDIKKTFKKQVKAEWEKSGVQAIVPKEFRDESFTKEIQVKDKAEQVTVTTIIPQELSN
ncbi:leucine-rich repeat protein [Carnobacterium maltaromaticum]|uniref:leucine-rich repeat protein n=1 Tax=Carnobacterium maltaromaticum TaxID=2751 RepID=UPI0039AEC00E